MMEMKEKFKQTFDEVHAPEDLLGKVMELNMKKREFKTRNLIKAAVCALVITTGVFAAGNGICYAATGESLVTKVKIIINGVELAPADIEWQINGEEYQGNVAFPCEHGVSRDVVITTDENPEDVVIDITTEEETGENGKANSSADMDETE